MTNNGISVYYAAKNSQDPKVKEMAAGHPACRLPDRPGRASRPSRTCSSTRWSCKYTKYPKAAKEYMRFMMEAEQYEPWLRARGGYIVAAAARLREERRSGPRTRSTRRTATRSRTCGRPATPASWAMPRPARGADFIMVNMVAEAASGAKTPKEAAERAQKRAERYYKV